MKKLFRLCLTFSTLKEACKIRSVSCHSGISKKLSIISILLRDFLTSFDKIDKKNGLDVAAAVLVVLLLEGQFLTTPSLKMQLHLYISFSSLCFQHISLEFANDFHHDANGQLAMEG